MDETVSVDDLWNSTAAQQPIFDSAPLCEIPVDAQRYLRHAIVNGTPLATAVRLKMHGEIKLNGWHRFTGEEVICWERGMIWKAAVRMFGLPVRGSDRLLDGYGKTQWKLFGILPLVNASGPDIARSVAGRVNIESIWLPSVLTADRVCWTASNEFHVGAQMEAHGEAGQIQLFIRDDGGLKSVCLRRWGNPKGTTFQYENFGAIVDAEQNFGGFTIPTRLRVGWYFGTDRFELEGEFFRVTIDDASYR